MTRHVLSVDRRTTLERASHKMRGHAVGCLVVLERGRVAGIITTSDLLGLVRAIPTRRPRADSRTAVHHRVAHRPRRRADGIW
jgi:CBS domain-containing protein